MEKNNTENLYGEYVYKILIETSTDIGKYPQKYGVHTRYLLIGELCVEEAKKIGKYLDFHRKHLKSELTNNIRNDVSVRYEEVIRKERFDAIMVKNALANEKVEQLITLQEFKIDLVKIVKSVYAESEEIFNNFVERNKNDASCSQMVFKKIEYDSSRDAELFGTQTLSKKFQEMIM